LGLQSPWEIKEVRFESITPSERELHIYIDFERGYKFTARTGEQSAAYDTEERLWRHLNFFQHRCYLHARVPRVKDSEGGIHTVEVPWARSGSGFTLLFKAYSMLLIESEMPVNKVSEIMGVTQPFSTFANTVKAHWSGIVAYFDTKVTNGI
jgi:transposase